MTTAAVETASTANAATAMEATTTVAAVKAASAADIPAAMEAAYRPNRAASDEPRPATVKARPPVESAPAVKTSAAVEPRTGADKDPAREPTRTIVTVRRARIGVVAIVAVLAHRSGGDVTRADSNADRKYLCMCERGRAEENSKQRQHS